MNEHNKLNINDLLKLNYQQVIEYLLEKYGTVKKDYFYNNINWNSRTEIKRGNEGLYIHHIDEDKAIKLSSKEWAKQNPWNYQTKERLVYANLLEHLILHIKITEIKNWPQNDGANEFEVPGIGGIYNFIIPELNDIYSGIEYEQNWKQKLVGFLKPLENDYFEIIKYISKLPWINDYCILKSFNEQFGLWSDKKNEKTYEKIMEIIPGQKVLKEKEKIFKEQQNYLNINFAKTPSQISQTIKKLLSKSDEWSKYQLEQTKEIKRSKIIFKKLNDKNIIKNYPLLAKIDLAAPKFTKGFFIKRLYALENIVYRKGNEKKLTQFLEFLKNIKQERCDPNNKHNWKIWEE